MMKIRFTLLIISITFSFAFISDKGIADPSCYLNDIKVELNKQWPHNRTVNLVFHGHSVPAGYFKTPIIKPFDAYPLLVLKELKKIYPYAVINVINTAKGGENAESGAKRFDSEVLVYKPDVLFIDYSLNDRGSGLERAKEAWSSMIMKALDGNINIILLTPSPDLRVDILDPGNILEQHAMQVRNLAKEYEIGLVDSYEIFKNRTLSGDSLSAYMSQINHPNEKGHELIANEIMKYFK